MDLKQLRCLEIRNPMILTVNLNFNESKEPECLNVRNPTEIFSPKKLET